MSVRIATMHFFRNYRKPDQGFMRILFTNTLHVIVIISRKYKLTIFFYVNAKKTNMSKYLFFINQLRASGPAKKLS